MSIVRRLLLIGAVLAVPLEGYAQEAVLTGTVTDATGGVLPGVTVTAVLEATGNQFEAVTDERGIYRLPVRVGVFQITASLPGFASVIRPDLQLLLGETVTVDLQLSPSTVQESVIVTAEAPLLKVATSNLGGNIDPRQVQEMPSEGRNWQALLLLAPGSKTTTANPIEPVANKNGGRLREYQINVDGLQVSSMLISADQPPFSQEMIGEMQFISNRFDATQGRSSGVQVNLVTKSGTNRFAGGVLGNFRNARFNAPNPVLNQILPISNQQYASSFGGPIFRDKFHFFAFHEYEHSEKTSSWIPPYPSLNISITDALTVNHGGGRLDYQLSPQTRLMARGNVNKIYDPFTGGISVQYPVYSMSDNSSNAVAAQLTNVLSSRALNEVTVGFSGLRFEAKSPTQWLNHWMAGGGPLGPVTTGAPRISFRGFTIGGPPNEPSRSEQSSYSVKDNFTLSYEARGRHDMKIGGEFIFLEVKYQLCTSCMGRINATGSPPPANLATLFPDPWNADTWNLAAISPITRSYILGVQSSGREPVRQPLYAAWLQDDWHLTNALTLNLGVRYDLLWNMFQNEVEFLPFMEGERPQNAANVQPRVGFAYQLNDRTVVRGGTGLYYGEIRQLPSVAEPNTVALVEVANDGRPDFAANPFNGPAPTFEEALTRFCSAPQQAANFAAWQARGFTGAAPCLLRAAGEVNPPAGTYNAEKTWQTTIGVQRQVGRVMAIEANYVYSKGNNEGWRQFNTNIAYNPATGINYPYTDRSRLPYPQYGIVQMTPRNGRSAYHALQTTFTKRMSHRWQASANYTLGGLWDALGPPFMGVPGSTPIEVTFPLALDLQGEYALAASDLRHRAVLSGIWEVGRGFQASAIHYTQAGERSATSYGGDLRLLGDLGVEQERLRPDGTIVPRNDFTQPARHRTNVRLQQRIPLGRVSIDVMAEAFNVFNRPNWTINTQESNARYGQRTAGENRTMQFGFRLTF